MRKTDERKALALLESMSGIISRMGGSLKPRELDKARQARTLLKKIKKNESFSK